MVKMNGSVSFYVSSIEILWTGVLHYKFFVTNFRIRGRIHQLDH